jgi:adenylate kinase family enzyme
MTMMTKRIYIIGGPGSGKSYAAQALSKRMHIKATDLDDIFWHKKDTNYTKKTPEEERDRKLNSILRKKRWIIEGSYTKWVSPIIRSADIIIILKTPQLLRSGRLIKRTIRRAVKKDQKQKENIKAFIKLMRFNHRFDKKHIKRVQADLDSCKAVILPFKKADDAITFFLSLR